MSIVSILPIFSVASVLSITAGTVVCAQSAPLADLDSPPPPVLSVPATASGSATSPIPAAPRIRALLAAADEALAAGLSELAASFYNSVAQSVAQSEKNIPVAQPSPALRNRALLGLASCKIERGDAAGAAAILNTLPASPVRDIRLALANLILGGNVPPPAIPAAAALSPTDLPWRHAALALAALNAGTPEGAQLARSEFEQSAALCEKLNCPAQARHIRMFAWLSRSKAGPVPDNASLETLRDAVARNAGTTIAFPYAKLLAIALSRLGKTAEAVNVLVKNPGADAAERNEASLLTGFILGTDKPEGRRALYTVLENNAAQPLPDLALSGLTAAVRDAAGTAGNSTAGTAGDDAATDALASEIYDKLTTLAERKTNTVPADLLHITRARVMFAAGKYKRAASAAYDLLTRSPSSVHRADALRVLIAAAWHEGAFQRASENIARLRDTLPAGPERDQLAPVAADCLYIVAQNYAGSDDPRTPAAYAAAGAAYAAIHDAARTPAERGDILLLRIRCELLAGNNAAARQLLDSAKPGQYSADALLRGEWQLAEHLRRREAGRAANREAARRLTSLLAEHTDIPAPFRIRFLWQLAQLAFAAGDNAAAAEKAAQIESVAAVANSTELPIERRDAVLARALLLRARASLNAGDNETAAKIFAKIRADYATREAAVVSYLVEGRALAAAGSNARARAVFLAARREFKDSRDPLLAEYAAEALYEAATQLVFLGDNSGALEALQNFANEYPAHPLAIAAQLRQADIFRRLNRFDDARATYERLREKLPDCPDRRRTDMGLADCLFARATSGGAVSLSRNATESPAARLNAGLDQAARAYEALFALPLPEGQPGQRNVSNREHNDMRAEAGYKWAEALSKRVAGNAAGSTAGGTVTAGNTAIAAGTDSADAVLDDAAKAYFQVISRLLKDPTNSRRLGSSARYWLARCYDRLTDIYEKRGLREDAIRTCQEAITYGERGLLPRSSVFETTLARLSAPTRLSTPSDKPNRAQP